MADWPSVHLPSFSLPSFPLSLPLFSRSSLHFVLSHAPLSQILLWSLSYGVWINNYLSNQRLSHLTLYLIQHYVTSYQWPVTYRWFSPCTPVSSINKTDRHDIAEILLKVAFNTINQPSPFSCISFTPFLTRMNITHVHVLFQLSLSGGCEMILVIEGLILIN